MNVIPKHLDLKFMNNFSFLWCTNDWKYIVCLLIAQIIMQSSIHTRTYLQIDNKRVWLRDREIHTYVGIPPLPAK